VVSQVQKLRDEGSIWNPARNCLFRRDSKVGIVSCVAILGSTLVPGSNAPPAFRNPPDGWFEGYVIRGALGSEDDLPIAEGYLVSSSSEWWAGTRRRRPDLPVNRGPPLHLLDESFAESVAQRRKFCFWATSVV